MNMNRRAEPGGPTGCAVCPTDPDFLIAQSLREVVARAFETPERAAFLWLHYLPVRAKVRVFGSCERARGARRGSERRRDAQVFTKSYVRGAACIIIHNKYAAMDDGADLFDDEILITWMGRGGDVVPPTYLPVGRFLFHTLDEHGVVNRLNRLQGDAEDGVALAGIDGLGVFWRAPGVRDLESYAVRPAEDCGWPDDDGLSSDVELVSPEVEVDA